MEDCLNDTIEVQGLSMRAAIPLVAVNVVGFFVGVFGNGLVVATIVKNAKFHNTQYLLIANLAVSDFLICTFCIPLGSIYLASPWTIFSVPLLCYISATIPQLVCPASVMTLIVIAVSRYVIVTKPRSRYLAIFDIRRVLALLSVMWLFLAAYGVFYWKFVIQTGPLCDQIIRYIDIYNQPASKVFYSILNSASLFVYLITIPVCYILTFRVVRKSKSRVHDRPSAGGSMGLATISNSVTRSQGGQAGGKVPLRTRANRTIQLSVPEIRLTRISSVIFFTNLILTTPFMVVNVFYPAGKMWIWAQLAFHFFALNSVFNPIIYGLLNKNLGKSIRKLNWCRVRSQS